jgi:hypothetical protein
LGKIDQDHATPSGARSLISGFFRAMSPKATPDTAPRSLKRHPLHPEHARERGTKWDCFFFHAGDAAKTLYDAYALDRTQPRDLRAVERAVKVMENRTQILERLADVGSDEWQIRGDDAMGYWLVTRLEMHQYQLARQQELEAADQAKHEKMIAGAPTPEPSDNDVIEREDEDADGD